MTDLYVGGGRGFAAAFAQHRRQQGHQVLTLSSQDHNALDWHSINSADLHRRLQDLPQIDFLLFNQNASALEQSCFAPGRYTTLDLWRQTKHWSQSYYVSCQLPFEIMHALGPRLQANTRVCWMLSSMIVDHSRPGHADYIGNKFQNYMIMLNFAQNHPAICFGLDPGDLRVADHSGQIQGLQDLLLRPRSQIQGRVWTFDGAVSRVSAVLDSGQTSP